MKAAKKKQHLWLDAEERGLAPAIKEFYREKANWLRPGSKAVVVSELELLKLGGDKKEVWHKGALQTRITFGGEGEARLIFTPYRGAWMVALEGTPSREEQRRELAKSGRGLWDNDSQEPVIAFQAADALLTCRRNWQDFSALPKSKPKNADVYRAMVNAHLTILVTLQALERDTKTEERKSRKLQVAFKLLNDPQWPRQIENLRDHALDLACDFQRPPSKKELKDQFDPPERVRPSEFSSLLKAAGLSWLKRGKRDRGPVSLR